MDIFGDHFSPSKDEYKLLIWRVQEALWLKRQCPFILGQCSNSIPFLTPWGSGMGPRSREFWGKPPGENFPDLKRDPRGYKQEAGCPDAAVGHGDTCFQMRLSLWTKTERTWVPGDLAEPPN